MNSDILGNASHIRTFAIFLELQGQAQVVVGLFHKLEPQSVVVASNGQIPT
jgi:hypothetical protein